jgi:prepilin-type N-terminal cleavage/methylation domain-containing protein
MKAITPSEAKKTAGFTLLEILVAAAIAAFIVAAAISSATLRIKSAMRLTEDRTLGEIQRDMLASLESNDFVNRNIFPYADAPQSMTPTNWYPSVDYVFTQTSAADWFAKIATMRGTTFTTAAPTSAVQPQLAKLLFNTFGRARLIIPCPLNESGQQRFVICSLMENVGKIQFPAYDGTDSWFEAVWNTDWTNPANSLPGYIAGLMTPAQVAVWNGANANSLLPAFRVIKVTVPKYTFVISNTSGLNNAYVYYNNNLNSLTSQAGSGVSTSVPILAGRMIQIYTGQTQGTAIFYYQRWLRKNEDITVQ